MTRQTIFLLAGTFAIAPSMAGCISGKDERPTTAQVAPAGDACSGLVDARRSAARRIDDIETGRSGGSAMAGLFTVGAVLGAGSYNSSMLADSAAKENRRALEELRSNKTRTDREIEEKQCTLDAKAKAGTLKAVDDAR